LGCNLFGDKAYYTVFDNLSIKSIVPGYNASIQYCNGAKEIIEWFSKKENQFVDYELDALMDKRTAEFENSAYKI
jgi:hypothetical protein